MRGCYSCAKVLSKFFFEDLQHANLESFGDYPLLSRFNLQGYFSNVWNHKDLSEILVKLVEACDKRDFKPVVESLLFCNKRRRERYTAALATGSSSDVNCSSCSIPDDAILSMHLIELDMYRTILYLAKYQCTTAFHTFFPATLKPCKGYHFWVSYYL